VFLFRLLAPLLLVALVYWAVYRASQRLQLNRNQFYWLLGLSSVLLFVLILIILGRLPIQAVAAPVFFLLTFLMRNAHWLARLSSLFRGRSIGGGLGGGGSGGAGAAGGARVSTIHTRWLSMELQHDSGEMDGEVLEGQFAGERLADLTLGQLLSLAGDCRDDNDSIQILEAYLDRAYPDWREQASSEQQSSGNAGSSASAMNEAEALAILGLEAGASEDDIVRAHRRLMQKMHPDRGGSDYLAQRINQARDFLLG
jgi:hypothetical protein